MGWLNQYASAVQALAAVATLLVTATLAVLTGRYVRLTRRIADSALEQVEHLKITSRTTQQQAARALDALSKRIRVPLAGLDASSPRHDQLLDYSLLSQSDIGDLESLARQVSEDAIRYAGKAAVSLRKIMGLKEEAHRINRVTGWMPNPTQNREWREAMDAGPKMLSELENACQKVAAA
jgi:hypothetical protein